MSFNIGDTVTKSKGYSFPWVVVAKFYTLAWEERYVVEMVFFKMLHIYNESNLELSTKKNFITIFMDAINSLK